jgi:hypothetical protein
LLIVNGSQGTNVLYLPLLFGGFLRVLLFPPPIKLTSTNKTYLHDITEILVNVALNTIKQINTQTIGNQWLSLLKFGVHFLYLVRCNGYSLHDTVSEWLLFNAKPRTPNTFNFKIITIINETLNID